MEIIIEYGDNVLQQKILRELSVVARIIERLTPALEIKKIIVPADYLEKIHAIQQIRYEPSSRGIKAVAKMVELLDNYIMVVSPELYAGHYDIYQRFFVYLHEINHALNRELIQEIPSHSISEFIYYTNLNSLFDEYVANREALRVIEKVFEEDWEKISCTIERDLNAFICVLQDERFMEDLEEKLDQFKIHADVLKFLQNIRKDFSEISLSIVFIFSIMDHFPQSEHHKQAAQASEFVNEQTLALMDYFRQKYEQRDFDLRDGLHYMDDFMTNFGTRFDDALPVGTYQVYKIQEIST